MSESKTKLWAKKKGSLAPINKEVLLYTVEQCAKFLSCVRLFYLGLLNIVLLHDHLLIGSQTFILRFCYSL